MARAHVDAAVLLKSLAREMRRDAGATDANVRPPGFAFASAISSWTFFAGSAGCTTRMNGVKPTSDRAKSRSKRTAA